MLGRSTREVPGRWRQAASPSRRFVVETHIEPAILELERAATRLGKAESAIEVVLEDASEYGSQTRGFVEQDGVW